MSSETDVGDLGSVSVLLVSVTAEVESSVSVIETDRLVVAVDGHGNVFLVHTVVVDGDRDLFNRVRVVVDGNLHGNRVVDGNFDNFVVVGHVDGVTDGDRNDGSSADDGSGCGQLEQFLALRILDRGQNGKGSDENPLVHV